MIRKISFKFNRNFFIIFSLFCVFLLWAIYLILFSRMFEFESLPSDAGDRYYLESREDYNNHDPYITKAPNLKNILAGPIISQDDPTIGKPDAPLTMVYFSDFSCNSCVRQNSVIKDVLARYGDKIRFVRKDYPESGQDSLSFKSSVLGRCVQASGKFWDYHGKMSELGEEFSEDELRSVAKDFDIDYEECLGNEVARKKVLDNVQEADALEIVGIPMLYINKEGIMGELEVGEIASIIEAELKK